MGNDKPVFGEVDGYPEGSTFPDRITAQKAKVHQGWVQGIAAEGTCICLNEGYADDIDNGDEIIYTGQGGRDDNTGIQVEDQKFVRGNKFLIKNYNAARPIRVLRGPNLRSPFAPTAGYRYDGLYFIERYWYETGKHGFKVYRFRLLKQNAEYDVPIRINAEVVPLRRRVETTISRVVRDTSVSGRIKELYNYTCQICSTRIETPRGPYAEACHVRPLGSPHDGQDTDDNLLCLCPNCHVGLDRFALRITEELRVNPTGNSIFFRSGHTLSIENVRYLNSVADQV